MATYQILRQLSVFAGFVIALLLTGQSVALDQKGFEKLIRQGIPVRRLGSAAIDLCWVAAGRFDGFYEHQLQAWDSAAGFLMVEEAGGKITDFEGNYYSPYQPHIIATNGLIHEELRSVVNGAEVLI